MQLDYRTRRPNAVAASTCYAFSDERTKRIEGRSAAARDLATLAAIEVTDYTYIDALGKGAGRQKKEIAQQVEKTYPQAVSRGTGVVPDIYRKAEMKDAWVMLATNLKKGERVRLIGKGREGVHEVLEVAPGRFRTAFAAEGGMVFVYGREVNDFRSVDYEAIAMLNVSATQELHRRLTQQAAALSAQTTVIESQAARIDMFEKQATEMAMLKRQMTELQAAVLAAGRPEVARLAAAR